MQNIRRSQNQNLIKIISTPIWATLVLGLVAIIVVFGFVGHGKLRISPWLDVEVPAIPGGNGGFSRT
jgi:hypothetical protein